MSSSSSSTIIEEILRYKKVLEDPPSDTEVLTIFKYLESLEVDRALLSKTKIGVAVAKHKQHENSVIGSKSRKLVDKWRAALGTPQQSSKSLLSGSNGGPKSRISTVSQLSETCNTSEFSQSIFNDEKPTNYGESVTIDYTGPRSGDVKRDKAREILYRAFIEGLPSEQLAEIGRDSAASLVGQIEQAMWQHYMEKKNNNREYQGQLRSIKSNFADKKNPEFNIRLYLGAISAEKVATMPSTEMASDAKKAERLKAKKDALEACQSDWDLRNIKRAAGQFPCGKCRSSNTTYFQMQTRSSDEPMTTTPQPSLLSLESDL